MPSGLNGFVQNRHEQKHKTIVASETESRRTIGQSSKVELRSSFKTPAHQTYSSSNEIYASNTALTTVNLSKAQSAEADGSIHHQYRNLFDGSTLSIDSDDTLKDTNLGNNSLQKPLQYNNDHYIPRHAPFADQDDIERGQSVNVDKSNDSDGEADGYEGDNHLINNRSVMQQDGLARLSRNNRFKALIGNPIVSGLTEDQVQKRMQAAKQTDMFKKNEKHFGNTSAFQHFMSLNHGRTGRLTGKDTSYDIRLVEERNKHVGGNRDPSPDNPEYSDSDLPQTPTHSQETDDTYSNHSKDFIAKREAREHISKNTYQEEDAFGHVEFISSSGQSSPIKRTFRVQRQGVDQKTHISQYVNHKRGFDELDYGVDALSNMTYTDLRNQPFDNDPNRVPWVMSPELNSPDVSLEHCLEVFAKRTDDEQTIFFQQMPIAEWEQCGDWFLDQFGKIMSRLKEARKAKRQVSKSFEDELSSCEEMVRGETEGIQEVMRQMRAGGEGVLKVRTA